MEKRWPYSYMMLILVALNGCKNHNSEVEPLPQSTLLPTPTSSPLLVSHDATISAIQPNTGRVEGGFEIRIFGSHFEVGTQVMIGNRSCTNVQLVSSSEIRCTAPANDSGPTNVALVSADGGLSVNYPDGFHYRLTDDVASSNGARPLPRGDLAIVIADPNEGTVAGFTTVDLTVVGLLPGPSEVSIGGIPCLDPVVVGDNTLRCMTGAAVLPGQADIEVTNAGRRYVLHGGFTYHPRRDMNASVGGPIQVVFAEPNTAPNTGGTRVVVTVTGLVAVDVTATSVQLGGVPCRIESVNPGQSTIVCTTQASQSVGPVDLRVQHRRQVMTIPGGFNYVASSTPEAAPPLPAPLAETAPVMPCRPYVNSEAQALQLARTERLRHGAWLDSIVLDGRRIGVTNADIPRTQTEAYVILNPELARQCGLRVGDSLSQAQIQEHPQVDVLVEAMMNPASMRIDRTAMNPAYNQRPITPAEEGYVNRLRQQVEARFAARNATAPVVLPARRTAAGAAIGEVRWYLGPHSYGGTLYVNPDFYGAHVYDSGQMTLLLNAIATNDEVEFLEALINLASNFDHHHAEAKAGFIQTFTYMFITKEFPSEGSRQNYLHFILRCGHIE